MAPSRFLQLLGAALALGLAATATAQNPPPYMKSPPPVRPATPYHPPTAQRDQLPNGLHIVVVEDHRFPFISVRMALRAGDSRVKAEDAGLAEAEADLLTAGTPSRTALQIAQAADAMGGAIGASAGADYMTMSADALSSRAPELFALLADVVLHANFPATEVALEKANMAQALRANRAEAGYLADVQFHQLLFGNHPYATIAPTGASIARLNRRELMEFHRDYFLPNNEAEVVVTGDIDAARAHNLVQQYFGDWRLGNPAPPPSPPVQPPAIRRIVLVDRHHSAQSTILLGNLGLTRTSPQFFPLLVANEVLGGSFNSRLIADVRERLGYAYGISSGLLPYRDLGAWIVSTQVRTAVTTPALQEIFAQLERMRSAPPTTQEMTQAKNYLTGNFVLGLQTQTAVANQFLSIFMYGLPQDQLATWVGDVESVTADQALAAAKAYIHPGRATVVVVGDVSRIEAGLANLAPGTMMPIYNERGKQIGSYPPEGPPHPGRGPIH